MRVRGRHVCGHQIAVSGLRGSHKRRGQQQHSARIQVTWTGAEKHRVAAAVGCSWQRTIQYCRSLHHHQATTRQKTSSTCSVPATHRQAVVLLWRAAHDAGDGPRLPALAVAVKHACRGQASVGGGGGGGCWAGGAIEHRTAASCDDTSSSTSAPCTTHPVSARRSRASIRW